MQKNFNFKSEYEKTLQIGTTNSKYNIGDITDIPMNENVCENEVSVLSTDESGTKYRIYQKPS